MKCAWMELIGLLPTWMRCEVDKFEPNLVQEIRLRLNQMPEIILNHGRQTLKKVVSLEDLTFCINIASRYSPWAASTISEGYITAQGGHRIGICGKAVADHNQMRGIQIPSSLCIRVAKDFMGISGDIFSSDGSILIIGAPGCGKTTLLRDLIRQRSDKRNECISVVDEKEEIFPYANKNLCFYPGCHTDILSGCKKGEGIMTVLRNMTPDTIAVDEITAEADCNALLHAGWCGVKLIATAHAGNRKDLESRHIYRPLLENKLFDTLLIIHKNKKWTAERMIV